MAYRKNPGGRPLVYPKNPKAVRDIMRRHMREEGKLQKDFSKYLDISYSAVTDYFYRKNRPMPPGLVDAFIEWLELDEFDALELRIRGAQEAGWQIERALEVLP